MSYTPENNPYIPGDPYSYDLKWLVMQVKANTIALSNLDDKIRAAVIAALDQHDPIYFSTAQELIDSGIKAGVLAYIEGYHAAGDGGANLYITTDDYNDIIGAAFYITLGANLWALPVIITPYVTPEMFGAYGDGSADDSTAFSTACSWGLPVLAYANYLIYQPFNIIGVSITGKNDKNGISLGADITLASDVDNSAFCVNDILIRGNSHILTLDHINTAVFKNVRFTQMSSITLNVCVNNNFNDCSFTGNTKAISATGGSYFNKFKGCYFAGNTTKAIEADNAELVFSGCDFEANSIDFDNVVSCTIDCCHFEGHNMAGSIAFNITQNARYTNISNSRFVGYDKAVNSTAANGCLMISSCAFVGNTSDIIASTSFYYIYACNGYTSGGSNRDLITTLGVNGSYLKTVYHSTGNTMALNGLDIAVLKNYGTIQLTGITVQAGDVLRGTYTPTGYTPNTYTDMVIGAIANVPNDDLSCRLYIKQGTQVITYEISNSAGTDWTGNMNLLYKIL